MGREKSPGGEYPRRDTHRCELSISMDGFRWSGCLCLQIRGPSRAVIIGHRACSPLPPPIRRLIDRPVQSSPVRPLQPPPPPPPTPLSNLPSFFFCFFFFPPSGPFEMGRLPTGGQAGRQAEPRAGSPIRTNERFGRRHLGTRRRSSLPSPIFPPLSLSLSLSLSLPGYVH
jgi:hypothetical protein